MRRRPTGLSLLFLSLCGTACATPTSPDAGVDDVGPDVMLPPTSDAGPRPRPAPPRPRPPDGGCPPPPDIGAAVVYELGLDGAQVDALVPGAGGSAWVVGRGNGSADLFVLELDGDGRPRLAQRLDGLGSTSAWAAAPRRGGGLHLVGRSEDGLSILELGPDGATVFASALQAADGMFRGTPLVAEVEAGVVVAAEFRSADGGPALQLARYASGGEPLWERRLVTTGSEQELTALHVSEDVILLVARTDAFASRQVGPLTARRPVTSPWLSTFDLDGALRWQVAFDDPEAQSLHLRSVVDQGASWLLGGATQLSAGFPWVVELERSGSVRTASVLGGLSNLVVSDILASRSALRLLQTDRERLVSGPVGDLAVPVNDLDNARGRARLTTAGTLYVGPVPACVASSTGAGHPALCGETRRDLMRLTLPGDRASACMSGIETTVRPSQGLEARPILLLDANADLKEARSSQLEATPTMSEMTVEMLRLCLSGPDCVRAYAVP